MRTYKHDKRIETPDAKELQKHFGVYMPQRLQSAVDHANKRIENDDYNQIPGHSTTQNSVSDDLTTNTVTSGPISLGRLSDEGHGNAFNLLSEAVSDRKKLTWHEGKDAAGKKVLIRYSMPRPGVWVEKRIRLAKELINGKVRGLVVHARSAAINGRTGYVASAKVSAVRAAGARD